MLIVLLLSAAAVSAAPAPLASNVESSTPSSPPPSDMLLPLHSTMTLLCEPLFHGDEGEGVWYKDGVAVANVSSSLNAVLDGREYAPDQPTPDVGFLVIPNISLVDEGSFWCVRSDNGEKGAVFNIRVAYVHQLPSHGHISFEPPVPILGRPFYAYCPPPAAVPTASIAWMLNSEHVGSASSDSLVFPNGTLFIRHFSGIDFGLYECVASNFAGKTSTKAFLDSKRYHVMAHDDSFQSAFGTRCSHIFRSSLLWFLIGCLVTSCGVLIYLLLALLCVRPTRNRAPLRPSLFLRAQPHLGPGFRKAIAPLPDFAYSDERQ